MAQQILVSQKSRRRGNWNTLCLPFEIEDYEGTIFADATVRTMPESAFEDGTLTLEFSGDLNSMEAARPYIVKWNGDGSDNLVNPTFSSVVINADPDNLTHFYGAVTFLGTYAPVRIPSTGDNTKLYLGADNTLYWPNAAMTIKANHAYFQLNGITAGDHELSRIVLNFGDGEASGISTTNFTNYTNVDGVWYDMSGRRLDGRSAEGRLQGKKPSRAGVYINNGNKIVIK